MPAISTAFIIIFAYAFGAYELPFLLGATLPRAFPVQAYMEFLSPDLSHRPYAMVYNGLMLAFGAGFIALYLAAFKKLNRDNQACGHETDAVLFGRTGCAAAHGLAGSLCPVFPAGPGRISFPPG